MQIAHKCFLVEKVEQLTAMEFHRIDKKQRVVEAGHDGRVGCWRDARAIPSEIIGQTIEKKIIGGDWTLVDVFVGETEDATGK